MMHTLSALKVIPLKLFQYATAKVVYSGD